MGFGSQARCGAGQEGRSRVVTGATGSPTLYACGNSKKHAESLMKQGFHAYLESKFLYNDQRIIGKYSRIIVIMEITKLTAICIITIWLQYKMYI